ncbi:DUF952 domain-containing protein [Evansella tamaricis]|uniref:DUF952 domain-containing protein n=1 Tax=Evansella tamaricis TaxID=2069301 RepID=A0ABS6JFB0_9BACI|nr:DUF952 domain-containing protein [Evansella tamaricis]MBU9711502.1 DUF952 domain-containing protein [Evansella tamaricis]
MIFHLLTKSEWEKAQREGVYWPESLDIEGYIDCFTKEQLIKEGKDVLPGVEKVILLEIYSNDLESLVVLEDTTESGNLYPHVYGHINLSAIKGVHEIKRSQSGTLEFSIS